MLLKRLLTPLAAVLVFGGGRLNARDEEWGRAVDGLQLSVALVPGSPEPLVRITLRSSNEEPVLVPLGVRLGRVSLLRFEVYVENADGTTGFDITERRRAEGQVEPLAVPIARYSRYVIEEPLSRWLALSKSDAGSPSYQQAGLRQSLGRTGKLWAEWDAGVNLVIPARGGVPIGQKCPETSGITGMTPSGMRCWVGKLVSNIISLPN